MIKKILRWVVLILLAGLVVVAIAPWLIPFNILLDHTKMKDTLEISNPKTKIEFNFVDKEGNISKEPYSKILGKLELTLKGRGKVGDKEYYSHNIINISENNTPVNIENINHIKEDLFNFAFVENGKITDVFDLSDFANKEMIEEQIEEYKEVYNNSVKDFEDEEFKSRIKEFLDADEVKVTSKPALFKKALKVEVGLKDAVKVIKRIEEKRTGEIESGMVEGIISGTEGIIIIEFTYNPYTTEVNDFVFDYKTDKGYEGINARVELSHGQNVNIPKISEDLKREKIKDITEFFDKLQAKEEVQKLMGIGQALFMQSMNSQRGSDYTNSLNLNTTNKSEKAITKKEDGDLTKKEEEIKNIKEEISRLKELEEEGSNNPSNIQNSSIDKIFEAQTEKQKNKHFNN